VTLTKPVEAEDRIDQSTNCHLLSAPINKCVITKKRVEASYGVLGFLSLLKEIATYTLRIRGTSQVLLTLLSLLIPYREAQEKHRGV
jgi:hypothetical protein